MGLNVKNILTGWSRYMGAIETPADVQELSNKRLEVCGNCEEAKESKVLEFISGSAEHLDIIYCSICKCPCTQKSLIPGESCPLGKWNF